MISLARLRDWILLILCFIWASSFVLVKVVQQQMGPLFATFFPITIATALLVVFVRRQPHKENTAANNSLPPPRDIFEFMLIGIFGMVVTQFFGTWGTRLSLASNGALLMLALPISTALMAYFLLGERMTRVRWISFVLAIAGVLQCSGIDWKELNMTSNQYFLGNLMLFISVFGSAFYNVYSKRLLDRYPPLEVLRNSYLSNLQFRYSHSCR